MWVISEKPWDGGKLELPCMPVCGVYICRIYVHNAEVYVRFYERGLKREMVGLKREMVGLKREMVAFGR